MREIIEHRTAVLVVTFQSTKSRKRKSDTSQLRETLTRVSEPGKGGPCIRHNEHKNLKVITCTGPREDSKKRVSEPIEKVFYRLFIS